MYGAPEIIIEYDRRNIISITSFDEQQATVNHVMGYAQMRSTYSDEGDLVEVAYYDADNKLRVNLIEGYAKFTTEYKNRQPLKQCLYGADNKLINGISGFAQVVYEYNDKNLIVKQSTYDINHELVVVEEIGYSQIVFEYNSKGEKTKEIRYTKKGIITDNYVYNNNGNVIKFSNTDESGALVNNQMGIAYWEKKYTKDGKEQETAFYNDKGNLTMSSNENYARSKKIYNSDELFGEYHFDENNKFIRFEQYNDIEATDLDREIDDDTFENTERVTNMVKFLRDLKLDMPNVENAFYLVQRWNSDSDNTYSDENLDRLYHKCEPAKDEKGWIKREEDFKETAWDLFNSIKFLDRDSERLLTVFNLTKKYIPAYISRKIYKKSEVEILVSTLLRAHTHIYNDETYALGIINKMRLFSISLLNKCLINRKSRIGNDLETSEVLRSALFFHCFK